MRQRNTLVAVAYLRVSTDEQQLGPEAQRAAVEAWAARAGVTVAGWHLDQGVSGSLGIEDRPGLRAAFEALTTHRAGILVAAKRDRIARDIYVAKGIAREVAKRGARIVCADGVGNGDSPADEFMRTILDGVAEFERAMIRARIKAALAVKRARGEFVGMAPYGHRVSSDGRTLEPEPGERVVLERVAQLRAEGASLAGIAGALNAEGLRSRSGGLFSKTQVARMVRGAASPAPVAASSDAQ